MLFYVKLRESQNLDINQVATKWLIILCNSQINSLHTFILNIRNINILHTSNIICVIYFVLCIAKAPKNTFQSELKAETWDFDAGWQWLEVVLCAKIIKIARN